MRARLAAWSGLLVTRRARVGDLELQVPPGVLDPALFRAGAWLAERAAEVARPGLRLLDLGCGAGAVAALAAARGATVVATDLDPRAVAAARGNGVADARQGDLFAPVAGERFDLICFNPPFFPGRSWGRPLGRALYGGRDLAIVRRFSAAIGDHLRPGGAGWVVWSERAPPAEPLLGAGWRRLDEAVREGERLWLFARAAE